MQYLIGAMKAGESKIVRIYEMSQQGKECLDGVVSPPRCVEQLSPPHPALQLLSQQHFLLLQLLKDAAVLPGSPDNDNEV